MITSISSRSTPPVGDQHFILHIELLDMPHPIWRRLSFPVDRSLHDLHCAIQFAMGWDYEHLHEFRVERKGQQSTFSPAPRGPEDLTDQQITVADAVGRKKSFSYLYDFGDSWQHHITVEGREKMSPPSVQPECLAGEGICPPEDCGGFPGFHALLEGTHWQCSEWEEEDIEHFRSGKFDPKKVDFSEE